MCSIVGCDTGSTVTICAALWGGDTGSRVTLCPQEILQERRRHLRLEAEAWHFRVCLRAEHKVKQVMLRVKWAGAERCTANRSGGSRAERISPNYGTFRVSGSVFSDVSKDRGGSFKLNLLQNKLTNF
jgi:hypothetical protein